MYVGLVIEFLINLPCGCSSTRTPMWLGPHFSFFFKDLLLFKLSVFLRTCQVSDTPLLLMTGQTWKSSNTAVIVHVCMHDRHHGLVPAEWLSAGLIRPRPQTQSLSHGLPELHVPVRGVERLAGAERLLEVEFHQPHVEFPQKQVSSHDIL